MKVFNASRIMTLALAGSLLLVGQTLLPLSYAVAATESVALPRLISLQKLHQSDVITLPTVRSQQVLTFTKPKTWTLGASSFVEVHFQHSKELLPKSWLQIIVNDQVIKHIPLTAANTEGTTVTVPIPVAKLKDFNTLIFRVEQHYTNKCEDPLDPSLWTQILPTTRLVLNYTPTLPKLDLASYPYPLVDTLQYAPAQVGVFLPSSPSVEALEVIALAQTHLGQHTPNNAVNSHLVSGTLPRTGHALVIGTVSELSPVGGFAAKAKQALANASPDTGFLALYPNPSATGEAILVVSGNSEKGLLSAAKALTTTPKPELLKGASVLIPASWQPGTLASVKKPRYIEFESKTLAQLDYPTEAVEKINAPPITFNVPIVSDFKKSGAKLFWDLVYSYSPGINPEFSSLELRVNNRSVGNIPLLKAEGENLAHATVPISSELLQPHNTMVAQFHLMPDKAGYCVDNYVDKAWGKIHDDSTFRVEGTPATRLPDTGLLNPTVYPYSLQDNLSNTVFVLPGTHDPQAVNTLLAIAGRLGRSTLSDTDLRLNVQLASAGLPKDKNVILLGNASAFPELKDALALHAQGNLKEFYLANHAVLRLENLGEGATLQQGLLPEGNNHIITVLSSKTSAGWTLLQQLFNEDVSLETLTSGQVKQLSAALPGQVSPALRTALASMGSEQPDTYGNDHWYRKFFQHLSWPWVVAGLAILVLMVLVFSLLGRLFNTGGPKHRNPNDPFNR